MLKWFKKESLGVVYNPVKQRYEKVTYGDEIFTRDVITGKIYPNSRKVSV